MIIAHLADVHLGFRAYSRTTPDGRNQREADVADAFARALDAVASLRPDLVLVAGDLFHSVRPSNAAIATAFRGFTRLAERLEGAAIVIVAGDRETPRSADTSSILELFREIRGVTAVADGEEVLQLDELDAEVVAVPHAALARSSGLRPLPPRRAGTRLLVAHGRIAGAEAGALLGAAPADGGADLPPRLIEEGDWDYAALGHHPISLRVAPNAWYAGSLERTSPDPWAEAEVGKGFIAYDTEAGEATLHAIATRRVIDLPRISARDLEVGEVEAAIESVVRRAPGGLDGAIARLVITDLARSELRRLDGRVVRDARAVALHFLLDARPPERGSAGSALLAARGVSLEAQVESYLTEAWEPTMDGIDRGSLGKLARRYLAQASEGGSGSGSA